MSINNIHNLKPGECVPDHHARAGDALDREIAAQEFIRVTITRKKPSKPLVLFVNRNDGALFMRLIDRIYACTPQTGRGFVLCPSFVSHLADGYYCDFLVDDNARNRNCVIPIRPGTIRRVFIAQWYRIYKYSTGFGIESYIKKVGG